MLLFLSSDIYASRLPGKIGSTAPSHGDRCARSSIWFFARPDDLFLSQCSVIKAEIFESSPTSVHVINYPHRRRASKQNTRKRRDFFVLRSHSDKERLLLLRWLIVCVCTYRKSRSGDTSSAFAQQQQCQAALGSNLWANSLHE